MNPRSNSTLSVISTRHWSCALFDGGDTFFIHGLRDEVADVDIPVRGDGGDLGNAGCGGYRFGVGGQVGDDAVNGGLRAAFLTSSE